MSPAASTGRLPRGVQHDVTFEEYAHFRCAGAAATTCRCRRPGTADAAYEVVERDAVGACGSVAVAAEHLTRLCGDVGDHRRRGLDRVDQADALAAEQSHLLQITGGKAVHSRVPVHAPSAPSISAAASPRPSAM